MSQVWKELEQESQRILIEKYSPAGFLVDADLNIVSLLGDTSMFLQPRAGRPSFNLIRMVHRKLLPHIQAAIDASTREGTARHESSALNDQGFQIRIEATPISTSTPQETGFLILLHRESIKPDAEPRRSQEEWSRLRREGDLMINSVTAAVEKKHAIQTELEQTRAELIRTREDIQRALCRIIGNHDDEHRSLARELHDVLSQQVAALGLELETLASQSGELPERITKDIVEVKRQSEKVAQLLHEMSRRLYPTMVELIGLKPALLDECGRWSTARKVRVDCVIETLPESLPVAVSVALYRVAQEALHNVAKHANASSVRLDLVQRVKAIVLSVEDNGQGFDLLNKSKEGLGFLTMATRIRAVDGRFQVKSQPGHGTIVEAEVPLK